MLQIFLIILLNFLQPDTNTYVATDGSFSILSPGAFTEKYQELTTDIGDIEVFTLLCQTDISEHPNFLYLINYYDYPPGFKSSEEEESEVSFINNLFNESIDQSVTNLSGNLLYSTKITLQDNYDGRLNRISYNDGASIVKSKMFLVENRFYFIQVYTTKENSLNEPMDEFLDSFKVLTTE